MYMPNNVAQNLHVYINRRYDRTVIRTINRAATEEWVMPRLMNGVPNKYWKLVSMLYGGRKPNKNWRQGKPLRRVVIEGYKWRDIHGTEL